MTRGLAIIAGTFRVCWFSYSSALCKRHSKKYSCSFEMSQAINMRSNVFYFTHAVYNAHTEEVKLGPSEALLTVHNECKDILAVGSTVDICYEVLMRICLLSVPHCIVQKFISITLYTDLSCHFCCYGDQM